MSQGLEISEVNCTYLNKVFIHMHEQNTNLR